MIVMTRVMTDDWSFRVIDLANDPHNTALFYPGLGWVRAGAFFFTSMVVNAER